MTTRRKGKTKLEAEKEDKMIQGEASEFLDQITQDDEAKAAKILLEKQAEADKATFEDKWTKEEQLDKSLRFRKRDYIIKLATMANEMMKQIDFPPGYTHWVGFDNEKMNIIITCPNGKRFGRGIKPVGVSVYDLHAIGVLLTQCENTLDQIMERGAYRKDGLIIPKK